MDKYVYMDFYVNLDNFIYVNVNLLDRFVIECFCVVKVNFECYIISFIVF